MRRVTNSNPEGHNQYTGGTGLLASAEAKMASSDANAASTRANLWSSRANMVTRGGLHTLAMKSNQKAASAHWKASLKNRDPSIQRQHYDQYVNHKQLAEYHSTRQ